MNQLTREKRVQVLVALVEGNSIRSTVRMTGISKNTITKLLRDVGRVCEQYQDKAMMDLPCKRIQVDEIWSFCYSKEKNVPEDFAGASVILSGLGMYGISSFFAIAPPGATAIVSIGIVEERIVPIDGNMKTRKTMSVALAANRRIVTDIYAAKYLNAVIKQIEDPADLTQ